MTPSLPCPHCGHVDDLEIVIPLGVYADKAVFWECRCGYPRVIEINHLTPQELVRKAKIADEMMDRVKRYHGFGKAG